MSCLLYKLPKETRLAFEIGIKFQFIQTSFVLILKSHQSDGCFNDLSRLLQLSETEIPSLVSIHFHTKTIVRKIPEITIIY